MTGTISPPVVTPSKPADTAADAKPDVLSDYNAGFEGEIESLDNSPAAKPDPKPDPRPDTKPDPKPTTPKDEAGEDEDEEVTPKDKTTDEEIDELDVVQNPEADKRAKDEADKKAKDAEEKDKPGEAPKRMKDLKTVYEKVKGEKTALETELAKAHKTIEQLKTANPDDIKVLSEKLKSAETRRDELEQEIRHLNYAASDEYKTKYSKPYEDAWARAAGDLRELTVELEDGSTRPATLEDLAKLASRPLGEARAMAKQMFGDSADDVMVHRRDIRRLAEAQEQALAESKKTASEREKAKAVEAKLMGEKLSNLYNKQSKEFAEKYPNVFKPRDGDTEGNTLLENGFAQVDRFFNERDMPHEERVKLHVELRYKAANHDRMALRLKRAAAKLKTTQAELAQYKASTPPGGTTSVRSATKPESVFEEVDREIDNLDER